MNKKNEICQREKLNSVKIATEALVPISPQLRGSYGVGWALQLLNGSILVPLCWPWKGHNFGRANFSLAEGNLWDNCEPPAHHFEQWWNDYFSAEEGSGRHSQLSLLLNFLVCARAIYFFVFTRSTFLLWVSMAVKKTECSKFHCLWANLIESGIVKLKEWFSSVSFLSILIFFLSYCCKDRCVYYYLTSVVRMCIFIFINPVKVFVS